MSSLRIVDVRSDTITQPTAEMRKAMHDAVVGGKCHHLTKFKSILMWTFSLR